MTAYVDLMLDGFRAHEWNATTRLCACGAFFEASLDGHNLHNRHRIQMALDATGLEEELAQRDAADVRESEAGETPYDLGERIKNLEAAIATAREELALMRPDLPFNAWVNAHPSIIKIHRARVALGAEQ